MANLLVKESLSRTIRNRVAKATVRIIQLGGRGVLVPGGYVLTDAHCITWDCKGGMALHDWYIERIATASGVELQTEVCAVEPVTDIAALGAVDAQAAYDEAEVFEAFVDSTQPIPLWTRKGRWGKPIPVWIFGKHDDWFQGTATRFGSLASPPPTLTLQDTTRPVQAGDSGSPVVDANGQLIGLVSWSSESNNGPSYGSIPIAHRALPCWLVVQILAAQRH
jgi:S1-C subfamily serine protease